MLIKILRNRITGEILEKDCFRINDIHSALRSKLINVKINNRSIDEFCLYISIFISIKYGLRKISDMLSYDIEKFSESEYRAFLGDWEVIEDIIKLA